MNLLRDRRSRLQASSPVDPTAAIEISLLLVVALVLIMAILLTAGAVTSWLLAQPPHGAAPIYHQLSEHGR